MEIIRYIIHYGMHLVFPILIAFVFFRKDFLKASLIMLLANLIDIDHILASPVFDPTRCSIGFHLFHSYYAIGIYFFMLFIPKTRFVSIGLTLHILTDFIDCLWI
ncbi:MAG: hypothetical protein A2X13_01935 [Bacteroidetes bacterium GWC2_33_15]|nr:MAG: hypothetical protein A2X10_07690 [Bacteroidetes bacterium GWA2_33_15]OFX52240.1 MAG: hypothetical protein A2X13_01935 [Bacteroidetes bacterium GWC2_33_15]OFX64394.1 MAG: hypothetical protein A2X15_12755 [Bacteroidetes bacterium GWB2_32_14]OFX67799.1 MAG: hypothetical protein A2X14_06580 [Bacteroidetes bacterium GWD2_33_33]HAN19411.1 hypothetical protein [Bacteroidales bacterium]